MTAADVVWSLERAGNADTGNPIQFLWSTLGNFTVDGKYSYAPEIFEHTQRIGEYFGLYENALFSTRVTEIRWLEDAHRWQVSTNHGDNIRARFVIQATGPANRPKLPGIPGITDYTGHSFHTSRWDYEYTGGDHNGELTKLADKRVAIIGTGATAIQCVPFLGAHAKQLYVFQRTPSSVDLRGNSQTDPEWYESQEAGWQRARRPEQKAERIDAILEAARTGKRVEIG